MNDIHNDTLGNFVEVLCQFFKTDLISVILHGSIIFNDLAPGYGDLDFLVVVSDDIAEKKAHDLIEIRKPFINGDYGEIAGMVEGAFLPIKMLNPIVEGKGVWWGTSGERIWHKNELGSLVLRIIKEKGVLIWGSDVRDKIPEIYDSECIEEIRTFANTAKSRGNAGELHSVDWLLTSARLILWMQERRFSSKTRAAEWGYENLKGKWKKELLMAKQLRLNPNLFNSREIKDWLKELKPAIIEAADEVSENICKLQT